MESFALTFWGVRGSIPTPGKSTLRYGGNTPCVELKFKDGPLFILDAGTGLRELGKKLLQNKSPVHAHLFISHYHWDHIQGLPFFKPAFDDKNNFVIVGTDDASLKIQDIISFQMDPKYFPISIDDMRANLKFKSIREEKFQIDGVTIETIYLNHPGYALGFKFTYKKKKIVYISDNEPFHTNGHSNKSDVKKISDKNVHEAFDQFVENKEEKLINFCHNSDVLIHDTQFFPEEYVERKKWGHSPYNYSVDIALKSRVKSLILFHHDPDHDDKSIDKILQLSKNLIKNSRKKMRCLAAKEGMVLTV